jgi:HK97 family phage prohead protease
MKEMSLRERRKEGKLDPYEFRAPCRIDKSFTKDNLPEGIGADVFSKYLLVFECTMSSSTMDFEGDIVAWKAIEKGAQQLNDRGIVLFNHNNWDPPIGRFLKAWSIKGEPNEYGIDTGEIKGYVGISKTASQIGTLIEEEILRDMSVGGILKKGEEVYDDDDRLLYRVINDWDLYEGSVVNMGANPDAEITLVLGKMLKKSGETELEDDENPEDIEEEEDQEEVEEVDVWESIQEQLKETLDSQKEEILAEMK